MKRAGHTHHIIACHNTYKTCTNVSKKKKTKIIIITTTENARPGNLIMQSNITGWLKGLGSPPPPNNCGM